MRVDRLVIETTRRCQLECDHCLRGDTQAIDMNPHYLRDFLHPITDINMVTFTGGEPFLNPSCIEHFINICKAKNIYVGNFYIATNGIIFDDYSLLSEKGIIQVARLHAFCQENEVSAIDISRTQFHNCKVGPDNLLSCFKFLGERGEIYEDGILAEGRAQEYGIGKRATDLDPVDWHDPMGNTVYLNCEGKVVFDCDYSYETQDELGIHIEEAHKIILKWNEIHDEEVDVETILEGMVNA